MTRARLHVLPEEHPAVAMFNVARAVSAPTWEAAVRGLMTDAALPTSIPDLVECEEFPTDLLQQSRSNPELRKQVLRDYKCNRVRPVLNHYDFLAYQEAAAKTIFEGGLTYKELNPYLDKPELDLVHCDFGPGTWKHYRIWSCVRMSGCWPMPIAGRTEMPEYLESCPYCGKLEATVAHVLVECVGINTLRGELRRKTTMPSASCNNLFLRELFRSGVPAEFRMHHIGFVGRALLPALLPHQSSSDAEALEEGAQIASAASVDAFLRYVQESVGLQVEEELGDEPYNAASNGG